MDSGQFMTDWWPDMENDPDAQVRIKKSVELLDAKDGMTVLDIGCHKQEARQYLPPKVLYCGIDCEKLHEQTIVKDIEGGFAFPEKVDRVLCLEVLEHLVMPRSVLQTMWTMLKDDGIAVVSLPNEATLFHRIRCLFGIVDQECFNYGGKHLHLPSLKQCRKFLSEQFEIVRIAYYITTRARGSKQEATMNVLLKCMPKPLYHFLSYFLPPLFARGFIFKLKKK